MEQFNARPAPAPTTPGGLGTSGVFGVPNLSPSVNPLNIDGSPMPWRDVLPGMAKPDRVRSLLVDALESLRTKGVAAQVATREIHADRNLNEAERHRRAAKTSADLFASAQNAVERGLTASRKSIEDLEAKLSGPAIEVSDVQAVEIRSKLSGMEPQKRAAAILKSIEHGSDLTAAVVLKGDPFLVDFLSDAEISAVRDAWGRARFNDDVVLLKSLQMRKTHLDLFAETRGAFESGRFL